MARKKAPPVMRTPSETIFSKTNGAVEKGTGMYDRELNGGAKVAVPQIGEGPKRPEEKEGSIVELVVCVAGIYASFLSWAFLQERITTTKYGTHSQPETFTYSIFLNTIQSAFAALAGTVYLYTSRPAASKTSDGSTPSPFPSRSIMGPLALVAVTSSLASPFGYASLKYIDYVTFILAKSCKLLPVMALHLTVFRKRYPFSKYLVVTFVTLGVAIFTLHHPKTAKKSKLNAPEGGRDMATTVWGLFLLAVNLLFDGLTNSTQDYIFQSFKGYTGPQMMVAQNVMSTIMTLSYLLISPYLSGSVVGDYLGMEGNGGELVEALGFISRNPGVGWDVLAFAGCGAVGQVFIFTTLAKFSSLLLVTVTVTRKMLTMVLSVLWFGHRIRGMQWLGVGLVFGGIGMEGIINRRDKQAKMRAKLEAAKKKQ